MFFHKTNKRVKFFMADRITVRNKEIFAKIYLKKQKANTFGI